MEEDKKDEVLDFLKKHVKMVLAINEANDYPNASLLHYVVTDSFGILFGTKRGFGKYNALVADPKVSFVVVEEGIDPLRVVDGRGMAQEITAELELQLAHDLFRSKNDAKWYVENADDFVMFEITPTSIRWLDATSGNLQIHDLQVG